MRSQRRPSSVCAGIPEALLAVGLLAAAIVAGCTRSSVATGGSGAAVGPGAAPSPGPAGEPAIELPLTARALAFEPTGLAVVAGRRIVIAFDDADPGVPHGLVLYADASRAEELARAPSIVGPDHARFEIPALRVGRYLFSCRVHPRMQATLRVDPG